MRAAGLRVTPRLAAMLALVLGALALACAAYAAISAFPRGLVVAALLLGAATFGLVRATAPGADGGSPDWAARRSC